MRSVAVATSLLVVLVALVDQFSYVVAKSVVNKTINIQNDDEMRVVLDDYDREGSLLCNQLTDANWNVQTHADTPEPYGTLQVRPLLSWILIVVIYILRYMLFWQAFVSFP